MAELLEQINTLREIPEEQHLLCPRRGEDGSIYFDEDLANQDYTEDEAEARKRRTIIKEAQDRKWLTLDALQILAFDGAEAEPHKAWVIERLNRLMVSCDVCVRVFHQCRAEWKARLQEVYDDDNILDFLRLVDQLCLDRIRVGLDTAKSVLLKAEPKQRGVRILPNEATYAFFEALSCDALLRNEELLRRHFDTPFQLIQTKKRLKIQTFLPSMTKFLFSDVEVRQNWAVLSWSGSKRNILPSEFDWAVRDHLVDAMLRVQRDYIQRDNEQHLNWVATFWNGVRLIVEKMDKDVITESLRGLDGDFYKLLIDHLPLQSEGFLDLVASMTALLEKSPTSFWDAMDATRATPASIAEQVLNNPTLHRILRAASEEDEEQMANLHNAFVWSPPYLSSIKPANLTPACRAFAVMLFDRLQADTFSRAARAHCFRQGLRILDYSFRKMNEGKTISSFVGQPTVNGMLEMLSAHIHIIVSSLKRFDPVQDKEDLRLALSTIQQAFTLESQSLAVERQLISAKQPSPTESPPSSPVWRAVLGAIDSSNIDLAVQLLIAGRNLIGLEPLLMKSGHDRIPPTVRHFNDRFKLLSQSITDVVDRLSEFDAKKLEPLFEQPAATSALISLLFSSTEDTRNSAIELLKVIAGQEERREALQHILQSYYKNVLQGVADSCRQVMRKRAFAPAPSLIKTCSDIVDVMCNSQNGLLRSRTLDSSEATVSTTLWKSLWDTLNMIFKTTEDWSALGYDKAMMMDFCRDTMQFADQLFDYCSIFVTALSTQATDPDNRLSKTKLQRDLLDLPAKAMEGVCKWLRLRDEYLSSKSVSLVGKLLVRLRDVDVEVDPNTLTYIEGVLSGEVRAKLSMQQIAKLQRDLETHLGHTVAKIEEPLKQKQGSIDNWMKEGSAASMGKAMDRKLLTDVTRSQREFQAAREARAAKEAATAKRAEEKKAAQQSEFMKKRQLDKEKIQKERAAAAARAKQQRGLSEHTAEAGSGLEGLGVLGKDQAPKGEGLMHSSDESDDEGDIDEELFGSKAIRRAQGPKTNIINEVKVQGPVKKRRVQRSAKDMRARLAPDLSSLHREILGWDYFHDGDFPPNSRPDIYSRVPKTFRTPLDYQTTFQPLLILEAWQGFVKSREENTVKPYEIRIVSRASVDMFQEVSSTMTHAENREIQVSEGDIVLLSETGSPSAHERHCLARVFRVLRKQGHLEVSYRVMPANPLTPVLVPNGTVYGSKIQSITPLEREYGALLGLQYYDLCDEIIRAKPSPLLSYKENQLSPLIDVYDVNKAQAKAVKSAIDNDAFTLIQGPPGSGKTKTIVAIVGAILSESLRLPQGTKVDIPNRGPRTDTAAKKLLVCAPSNAAVDELVMRFKKGIKTLNGSERQLNVVRIGRSDAINVNVQDVTLEELVNKKLGLNDSRDKDTEATRKLFQEHKDVSEQLRRVRDELDSGTKQGPAASKLQDDLNALRKRKQALGTKIDATKDNERLASRNAELNRRRAQEQILGEAHVICATLSGSGHDMFQGINIEFETVIVDEAAQCVEMSAIIPLKYGCAKCILVGDPKQLPPTVFSKEAARFQYEQSLFVRMQGNHPNDVHLLDTQYRMHPEISLFPSQTFYDGKLLDGSNMAALRKRPWHASSLLGPYRFYDVQGQHQAAPKGHSLINIAEINVALLLYNRIVTDFPNFNFKGKVGIITPYKSQLRELKLRFSNRYGPTIVEDVEFNTTDAFQGRESEIIIFSCVRASPSGGIGFLQDIRRMNVGLTRAKSSLWVLGNSESLIRGEFWRKLVEDARRRKRFTDGKLETMLNKHSNNFPAPKEETNDAPVHIKQEPQSIPMRRLKSGDSSDGSMSSKKIKQEIKEETKPEVKEEAVDEVNFPTNGKRKFTGDQDEDVDMKDADSDAMSHSRSNSNRSTPAAALSSARNSATPNPDSAKAGTETAPPKDTFGGMPKPKIRRRPRPNQPVDPFIKRQPTKKPRPN